jgi:hypothetical protein
MKLYIKVIDGKTIDHPAFEENLLYAFPDGIPVEFEPFERILDDRKPGFYEKTVCSYVKNENGVWQDKWQIVSMSQEERQVQETKVTDQINDILKKRKETAKDMIIHYLKLSELNSVNVWQSYLERLNNWSLISLDPITPTLPNIPIKESLTNDWVLL